MSGSTPNYGLYLMSGGSSGDPAGDEEYDVDHPNNNMRSLDTVIKAVSDRVGVLETEHGYDRYPNFSSDAARDAAFPTPASGTQVYRTDKFWVEQYFSLYDSTTNPGGATPAGWYPVAGVLPFGRFTRTTSVTLGGTTNTFHVNSASPSMAANALAGGMAVGTSTNNGDLVVPVTGRYRITAHISCTATSAATLGVLKLAAVRNTTMAAGVSATDMESVTGINIVTENALHENNSTGVRLWMDLDYEMNLTAADRIGIAVGSTNVSSSFMSTAFNEFFQVEYLGPAQVVL